MRCSCKINLYLKVTGQRPDGYHTLSTLFLPLDVPADNLVLQEGQPGIRCVVDGGEIPDNLVTRAARYYADAAKLASAWDFLLEKKIPMAAGLGGGSSDAAGALKLLNEKYRCFSGEELASMAIRLGADVPFFLKHDPAWASGIGEELRYFKTELTPPVVIVNPLFPVSARWAYCHLAPENTGPADPRQCTDLENALRSGDWEKMAENLRNDLGIALYRKFPLLRLLRDTMISGGALNAEISGSGSSLFAVCRDGKACAELRKMLHETFGPETLRIYSSCDTGH